MVISRSAENPGDENWVMGPAKSKLVRSLYNWNVMRRIRFNLTCLAEDELIVLAPVDTNHVLSYAWRG